MNTRYVGLDVHSKNCVYVIQDQTGKIVGEGAVKTSPVGLMGLRDRYELPPGTKVALESGTVAFHVFRQLVALDFDPVVIDAQEVRAKAIRRNQKSDRRDALELCEGLRSGMYRTKVHVPPQEIEHLRETLGRRRHFIRMRTREINAAKGLLRTYGLPAVRTLGTAKAWERLLAQVAGLSPNHHDFLKAHYAVWASLQEQIGILNESLQAQSERYREAMDRLQTVPGVGPIVAVTTIAVLSDVHRFPSSKHVASYAGLVPSSYDSGERVRHGRITKRGSTELRAMLCEAAQQTARTRSPLYPLFISVCARRGYKMAIIAMAHRLCRILYAMLRRGTRFDLSKLGIEEGRFEEVRVRQYRRVAVSR